MTACRARRGPSAQVGSELRQSHPERFTYLHVGIQDEEQEDLMQRLPRCLEFISKAVGGGACCSRGVSVCHVLLRVGTRAMAAGPCMAEDWVLLRMRCTYAKP